MMRTDSIIEQQIENVPFFRQGRVMPSQNRQAELAHYKW